MHPPSLSGEDTVLGIDRLDQQLALSGRQEETAMTKLGRATTVGCLFLGMLVVAATSWAQTRPRVAEQIAKTYGLDSFEKIEAIRYTFNAQLPGVNLSRSWVWQPKTGQVSYEGKDKGGNP